MSRNSFHRDRDRAIIVNNMDGVHVYHFHDSGEEPNHHRIVLSEDRIRHLSWVDAGIEVTYSGALVAQSSLLKIQALSKEVLAFHKANK